MQTFLDALREALNLLANSDPALLAIAGMTLRVTGGAMLLAALLRLVQSGANALVVVRDGAPIGQVTLASIAKAIRRDRASEASAAASAGSRA